MKERLRLPVGVLLVGMGVALGWLTMYRPVMEAQRTGVLHYLVKGVLFPPVCVYLGGLIALTKLRDGQIRRINANGKPTFTRAGWLVVAGTFVAMGVGFVGWAVWARSMGFDVLGV